MGRLIRFSSSALRRLLLFSPPLPLVFSGILWSSFFSPSSSSADADIVRTGTQRGNLNWIDPMRRSRRSGKRHGFPSHSRRKAPSPPLSLSRSLSFSLFFFRCAARFCLNKAGRAIQLPFSVPFRTFNYLFRFNGVKLDRKHAAALAVPPRFSASSLRQVNAIIINGML